MTGVADLGFFHPRSLIQPEEGRNFVPEAAGASGESCRADHSCFRAKPHFPSRVGEWWTRSTTLVSKAGPMVWASCEGALESTPIRGYSGRTSWATRSGRAPSGRNRCSSFSRSWRRNASAQPRFLSLNRPALAVGHQWIYRGQITPENRQMTIRADIKRCDLAQRLIIADGELGVDGVVIYRMRDFSLRLMES